MPLGQHVEILLEYPRRFLGGTGWRHTFKRFKRSGRFLARRGLYLFARLTGALLNGLTDQLRLLRGQDLLRWQILLYHLLQALNRLLDFGRLGFLTQDLKRLGGLLLADLCPDRGSRDFQSAESSTEQGAQRGDIEHLFEVGRFFAAHLLHQLARADHGASLTGARHRAFRRPQRRGSCPTDRHDGRNNRRQHAFDTSLKRGKPLRAFTTQPLTRLDQKVGGRSHHAHCVRVAGSHRGSKRSADLDPYVANLSTSKCHPREGLRHSQFLPGLDRHLLRRLSGFLRGHQLAGLRLPTHHRPRQLRGHLLQGHQLLLLAHPDLLRGRFVASRRGVRLEFRNLPTAE